MEAIVKKREWKTQVELGELWFTKPTTFLGSERRVEDGKDVVEAGRKLP